MSLKTNKRLAESILIDGEICAVTSASTLYSKAINMEGVDEVVFNLTMPSGVGAGAAVPITIVQAESATKVQSSNAGSLTPACTTQVGSTVANYVYKGSKAFISISSAATDAQSVIINARTYTISTANAATARQFGCTDGTTGAAGNPSSMAANLAALINSTVSSIGVPGLTAALTSAASTTIQLSVNDTASTSITITTTGGGITPSYGGANVKVSVKAEGLNSTSKYICAVLGSCATAASYGLQAIRVNTDWRSHGITKIHKAT